MASPICLDGVPFPLHSGEASWHLAGQTLHGSAGPNTDLFVDPGTAGSVNAETLLNAPRAIGATPPGDFQFMARVDADLNAQFDAGVLLLWVDDDRWAKFCFELSPDAEAMVVSVVNRGVCDDANGFVVDGRHVWLRIARVGKAFAFHASTDGGQWSLVRVFSLGQIDDLKVGFAVQSPTGQGCSADFSEVRFASETLTNLRDGS